jgi:uncharacterized membrane protein YcfT
MSKDSRELWDDNAKGICIILAVIGISKKLKSTFVTKGVI